jgi:hypothetical protein
MSSESEKIVGVILRTNGKVESYTYTGYESIRAAVGGGIEAAMTGATSTGERWDLWGHGESRLFRGSGSVDDDGKLLWPNNQVARKFVAEIGRRHSHDPLDLSHSVENVLSLHGDYLILGTDNEGDWANCPQEIVELAKECAMTEEEAEKWWNLYDPPQTQFISFDEFD